MSKSFTIPMRTLPRNELGYLPQVITNVDSITTVGELSRLQDPYTLLLTPMLQESLILGVLKTRLYVECQWDVLEYVHLHQLEVLT
jgi:hypothetical protein